MIKKLAIVRNKLSMWNNQRDHEYIKNEEKAQNNDLLAKSKSLNLVKRPRRASDDFDIIAKSESLRNTRNQHNSKMIIHTQSLLNQEENSEFKQQNTNNMNKYIEDVGLGAIPENVISPKRRAGQIISKFSFSMIDGDRRNSVHSHIEQNMHDDEKLLESLKKEKLNFILKFIIWIKANMTNDVLIKFDQKKLEKIKWRLESGSISVRTKIEEALIKDHKRKENDALYGSDSDERPTEKRDLDYNINKYKKWHSYILETLKLIFNIIVSNTDNFWYIFMILAHIENANMLSLVYPFSIFAYALLEETRPKNTYWLFIIGFTCWTLFGKYLFQTYPLNSWISESLNNDLKSWRVGLHVKSSSEKSFLSFYIYEILVLMFWIIHMLKLISTGLWDKRETDIENIEGAVERLYNSQNRYESELQKKFTQLHNQRDITQVYHENLISECSIIKKRKKSTDSIFEKQRSNPFSDHIKMRFWKPTKYKSRFETYKWESVEIDLEAKDHFEYEMGFKQRKRLYSQGKRIKVDSMSILDSVLYDKKGYLLPPKALSEYIYEEPTFEDCKNFVKRARSPKNPFKKMLFIIKDFALNNPYFQTLFPKVKEQKPGKDLYLWIGIIQFIILIFLIPFYTAMDKDYTNDSSDDFATNQFSGSMVLAVFVQIAIIIADRYFYISRSILTIDSNDLKIEDETTTSQIQTSDDGDEGYARSNTTLSKKYSLNLRSSFMLKYLPRFNDKNTPTKETEKRIRANSGLEENDNIDPDDDETQEISLEKNMSNKSIMFKYYFQLILLVFVHYMIFWYFPNKGNKEIQTHAYCDYSVENANECNEVRLNSALWIFYLIYWLYFTISGLQIRYGLPELRKGVFVTTASPLNKLIFVIYRTIPFLVELKIITDWTFTKTALDLFQWIQFETIYADLFIAKCENKGYMNHPLGRPQSKLQKILIGGLFLLVVVALVAGPLAIFSSLNPVATDNKVTGALLKFSIEVAENEEDGVVNVYSIYENNYVTNLQNINNYVYKGLHLDSRLETRSYDRDLFQVVEMNDNSDSVWTMSPPNQIDLYNILDEAYRNINSTSLVVNLNLYYTFERPKPEGTTGEEGVIRKDVLDPSLDNREEILRNLRDSVNPQIP